MEKKKYFPGIQVLRAVLFLMILAFHCNAPFTEFGWGGVETFFVLSGFFLAKKLISKNNIYIKDQFLYRIYRLYPPYLLVLIMALAYAAVAKLIPSDIFAHLTFTQNLYWIFTDYSSPLQIMTAHTWTLSIEVWCGLILLIVIKYVPKCRINFALTILVSLSIAFRVVMILFDQDVYSISLSPIAHMDAFAIGACLAYLTYKNEYKRLKIISICSLGIGMMGIVISIVIIAKNNTVSFIKGYSLLSSSIYYLNNIITGNIYLYISLISIWIIYMIIVRDIKKDGIQSNNKINNTMIWLGNKSYELYLFHWPILVVIKQFTNIWILLYMTTFIFTIISVCIFGFLINKTKGGIS